MNRPTKIALGVAAATLAGALGAGGAQAAAARDDLTGFWLLQPDSLDVPAAPSTAAAAREVEALVSAKGVDAPNGSPAYARLWCTPEGLPAQGTHTLPMGISVGPISVDITYDSIEAQPRHIYVDGQPHPDADVFDFVPAGHSIGRWQGGALVADTRYFMDGIRVIPGGGLRTEQSRLAERYVLADHDTLRVTYTWTDPTTLRRPHSYTLVYKRAEGPVWPKESQCTPVKAMREKGYKVPYDAPG